jgi:hypothetical protein
MSRGVFCEVLRGLRRRWAYCAGAERFVTGQPCGFAVEPTGRFVYTSDRTGVRAFQVAAPTRARTLANIIASTPNQRVSTCTSPAARRMSPVRCSPIPSARTVTYRRCRRSPWQLQSSFVHGVQRRHSRDGEAVSSREAFLGQNNRAARRRPVYSEAKSAVSIPCNRLSNLRLRSLRLMSVPIPVVRLGQRPQRNESILRHHRFFL